MLQKSNFGTSRRKGMDGHKKQREQSAKMIPSWPYGRKGMPGLLLRLLRDRLLIQSASGRRV